MVIILDYVPNFVRDFFVINIDEREREMRNETWRHTIDKGVKIMDIVSLYLVREIQLVMVLFTNLLPSGSILPN